MKTVRLAAILSFACPIFTTVSTQAAETAGSAATGAPVPDAADKKICRRDIASTGSIMSKRVCHTKKEWAALEQAGHDHLDQMREVQRSMTSGN